MNLNLDLEPQTAFLVWFYFPIENIFYAKVVPADQGTKDITKSLVSSDERQILAYKEISCAIAYKQVIENELRMYATLFTGVLFPGEGYKPLCSIVLQPDALKIKDIAIKGLMGAAYRDHYVSADITDLFTKLFSPRLVLTKWSMSR